jgi:hypothetical protein
MNVEQQLTELEKLAEALAVRVTYEPMAGLVQGKGGLCKVRGEYRIIIDRRLTPRERIQIIAGALSGFDTDTHFVPPQIRDLLSTGVQAGAN